MINYQTTGPRRKKLVNALSRITGQPAKYLGVPSCAFRVGNFTVSRSGEVSPTPSEEIQKALKESGFGGEETTGGSVITIPRAEMSDLALTNFENMVVSKRRLLRRALCLKNTLPYDITEDALIIRWFESEQPKYPESAQKLVYAMIRHAQNSHRISAKVVSSENPRYSMRAFLYALGFSGAEYHDLRMELIGHLEGDVSFRRGHRKKKEPVPSPLTGLIGSIYYYGFMG